MYRRNLQTAVETALSDTPVVLLNGARQTGKTTLAQQIGRDQDRTYLTLDDAATLGAASQDPESFVRGLRGAVVIDEVQKAPALLPAIKQAVDDDRSPGRFFLTGSANVMSLPTVSESLAGRIEILTLWPLSQGEINGVRDAFIDAAFDDDERLFVRHERTDLGRLLVQGGYPEAIARRSPERRAAWFDAYVTTMLQRDVRDIAQIEGLVDMPRLLALLAARTAALMNVAELSRASGIAQTTLKRYLALLELTYLARPLPAWSRNPGKRLVKSHKLHLVDAGLAAYLARRTAAPLAQDEPLLGNLLESFVVMELHKQASWSTARISLSHFRTTTGREVDVVLEGPAGRLVGVEIKASASIGKRDFSGLHALADAAGEQFLRGILLYNGAATVPFGDNMIAAPISSLWARS